MLEKDLEIKDTDKQWRKFVDLFNEWWEEEFEEKGHFTYTMRFDHAHIIDKKFWFIEWLVKKKKVDFELDEIIHKHKWIDYKTWKWIVVEKLCNKYESLLMLLSIEDNPITFLLSILK